MARAARSKNGWIVGLFASVVGAGIVWADKIGPAPAAAGGPVRSIGDAPGPTKLARWTEQAVAEDAEAARAAIAGLRAAGPAGLQALLTAHRELVDLGGAAADGQADPRWARLQTALDAVGGQRNCLSSGLYWHTDFDAAMATAQREHKPILSLRLLGKLTDELSCANSRFFRTTLYANAEIRRALAERFVLHWQTVRPVPQVTIDFGDGRKLVRTVTGNSIHYLLDEQGHVVDALPGLYGPAAFLRELERAEAAARRSATFDDHARAAFLADYHHNQLGRILTEWRADLGRVGFRLASDSRRDPLPPPSTPPNARAVQASAQVARATPAAPPTARRAGAAAVSKTAGEARIVDAAITGNGVDAPSQGVTAGPPQLERDQLEANTSDGTWLAIARLHGADAQLDAASRALVARHLPNAAAAGRRAMSKRVVEDPLLKLVAHFQESVALDTVKNEYLFHTRIHQWLAEATGPLDELNERVYAELFLTPSSDPWLGLLPDDTYTALENGGVVQ